MLKTILCYGDSNTWGYNPQTEGRYPWDRRWTGLLHQEQGEDYRIIEEGLSGRTVAFTDADTPFCNGLTYLLPCLLSHLPLHLVVLMLGSNDTKISCGLTAEKITAEMDQMLGLIEENAQWGVRTPEILLVAPMPIRFPNAWPDKMDEESAEKSRRLGKLYRELAQKNGCHFLDAAEVLSPLGCDGVHFTADNHREFAQALAGRIKRILG